ncbi:uncharacterized protein DDB_G0290301-like [Solanum pennellii]|uniref:Uncharacterized protein DDB_G0290301-like n=1 Tax=Solanum pennellii TaxID=28526 RepID=A0ABM1GKT3_SOLPN|nr:uncharacterized protein DDB_G0290301-like [Solanum pennellii]
MEPKITSNKNEGGQNGSRNNNVTAYGGNQVDIGKQMNREKNITEETVREESVEANLASKLPYSKALFHEQDIIEVESSANSSYAFNPNAAGVQGHFQQQTFKAQAGEANKAARLTHIHVAQASTVVLKTTPRQTTKQGKLVVIFDKYDYMHTLTVDYQEDRQNKIKENREQQQQQQQSKDNNRQKQTEQKKEEECQIKEGKTQGNRNKQLQIQCGNLLLQIRQKKNSQQTGITTKSQQFSFTNLEVQEKQNAQGEERGIKDQREVEVTKKEIKESTAGKQKMPRQQEGKNRNADPTGIIDVKPNTINDYEIECLSGEVDGGMDGGCQESLNNMLEGVTKGGNLPHVFHDGVHIDHNRESTASASPKSKQQQSKQKQPQQQSPKQQQDKDTVSKENQHRYSDHTGKQKSASKTKEKDTIASTGILENTPKSKNTPSKQKGDAAKRRMNKEHENEDNK